MWVVCSLHKVICIRFSDLSPTFQTEELFNELQHLDWCLIAEAGPTDHNQYSSVSLPPVSDYCSSQWWIEQFIPNNKIYANQINLHIKLHWKERTSWWLDSVLSFSMFFFCLWNYFQTNNFTQRHKLNSGTDWMKNADKWNYKKLDFLGCPAGSNLEEAPRKFSNSRRVFFSLFSVLL